MSLRIPAIVVCLLGLAASPPAPVSPSAFATASRDTLVYVAQTGRLSILDVANPARPQELGHEGLPGEARAVRLEGDRAYVALGTHGVAVVDVSDPRGPRVLGRHETPGSVEDVVVRKAIAYLADGARGLEATDLGDPSKPRSLASIPTRDQVRGLAWRGDLLATAERTGGTRIYDVSRPEVPQRIATVEPGSPVLDVALCDGDVLLLASGERELLVYDIRDVRRPRRSASVRLTGRAQRVTCEEGVAAVSCGDAGLALVRLGAEGSASLASEIKLPRGFPARAACLAGSKVLVAAGTAGLGVIDATDPDHPQVLVPRARRMRVDGL